MIKKILFITGTRADFGKLKPLIRVVEQHSDQFEYQIFATGMHTLSRYGYTVDEIYKTGFQNVHLYMNQIAEEPMDLVLANTISGLSRFIREYKPQMLVVHGDRIEALAGAIVGALNNILVVHVEGGEVSGTVDGLIRHSISKLSHIHFVSNHEAKERLVRLGEYPDTVFVIGSPDIDVMLSDNLPSTDAVRNYYDIRFEQYAIAIFHPVTTEVENMAAQAKHFVDALIKSALQYVIIYPNNDAGSDEIFRAYEGLKQKSNFKFFPSLRFEYFLTLLKRANFIIGNSSAGIREATVYAVPTINVGSRQDGRFEYPSILNVPCEVDSILKAIANVPNMKAIPPCQHFGHGDSAKGFINILLSNKIWNISKQKRFFDVKVL